MSRPPKRISYKKATYVLVEGGQPRLVKKFQGRILSTVTGTPVATEKEFSLFKEKGDTMHGRFMIVHLPTKFALTFVPFGSGIGQTDAEPGPGRTVTEDAALARAKEILSYYAKNFGGMKTSISKVTGSMRALGPNYLAFLSVD
jgi:hypothetical protein